MGVYFLFAAHLLSASPDSSGTGISLDTHSFSSTPLVFHHPHRVLFNVRPFDLEVFVKIPRENLNSVSLFYQTNTMGRFREIPMPLEDDRFRFLYNPLENPADKITYFFVVTTRDGKLYAAPTDSSGILRPQTNYLLNPEEYFKKRAALREK